MNLGCDISKGGRDQLLIDLVDVHLFKASWIASLDEMLFFGGVRDASYDRLGERFEITAGLVQTSIDASAGRGETKARGR